MCGYINIYLYKVYRKALKINIYSLLYNLYDEIAAIVLVIEIGKRNYRGYNEDRSPNKPPTREF